MQLASQSLNRWLSLRLEAVGAVVSFAAAALAIEQQGQAAWAGLTLSYALQMTSLTTMTVCPPALTPPPPRPSVFRFSFDFRTFLLSPLHPCAILPAAPPFPPLFAGTTV